jgi:hypothetical protein
MEIVKKFHTRQLLNLKNLFEFNKPLTKTMKIFYIPIRNLLLRVRSQADLKNFHEKQKSYEIKKNARDGIRTQELLRD